MLQCYSYLQILGFLRRVDSPSGDASSSKLVGPRQLHASSIPFLCVVQTPEHAKVGIRNARKDALDFIKTAQKDGLPENEAKAGETKVQDLTDKFNRKVDEMIVVKDKDIMTI